ncbi:2-nitropropane dioxygenase-like enzyme [Rhodobacteraceae bacterium HIMB11]|nr:2-nitropropane dioxygenase-like enzyme [Rhodobacteraceae bacterium HIMB11]
MTKMTSSTSERIGSIKSRLHLPAICAPMFLVTGPDMVISACKSGVLGTFPATNARTEEQLVSWLDQISTSITKADAPWALNMITHNSYGRFDSELDLVRQYRPELVITALGGPHRVTDVVHGYGGLVFADVNSPKFARKAIEKGADGLVLICAGAGGHTGEYAMIPFVEEVRTFFDGPIIVGGGIGTGRGIKAVEALGVDFAYLGTRFLACQESLINDEYRQMVWDSKMEDLIASRAITGALGNWMRASVEAAGLTEEAMKAVAKIDFSQDMHAGTKAWKHVWSAGQGVGLVNAPETVADVVETLVRQYST